MIQFRSHSNSFGIAEHSALENKRFTKRENFTSWNESFGVKTVCKQSREYVISEPLTPFSHEKAVM